MSRRLKRFQKLREMARVAELDAAQAVSRAQAVVDRERQRLQRMEQEHTQRCSELAGRNPGDSLEVDREFKSRIFLEGLEKKIASQVQAVVHANQRLEEHVSAIQKRRSHRRALERVEERILMQEQQSLHRREQSTLDEIGINAFRSKQRT